jgi:prophage regulatory protein
VYWEGLTLIEDQKKPVNLRSKQYQHTASVLPDEGFVRLAGIIGSHGPIPESKSTWRAESGCFPTPVKLGAGVTVRRVRDVPALVERAG